MKFANSVFSTEAPNTPAPIPKGKTAFQTFLFFIFFLLPAVVVVSQLVAAVNLSALSAPLHRSKPPTVVTYCLHTLSLVIEQFGPRFRTAVPFAQTGGYVLCGLSVICRRHHVTQWATWTDSHVFYCRNYMTEPHTTEPSAVSHNPLFIPSCLATFIYINTRRFHLDSADNLKERGRGDWPRLSLNWNHVMACFVYSCS